MKSQSPSQSRPHSSPASTANFDRRFAAISQRNLFEGHERPSPGTLNDRKVIREVLVESIKNSGKSRAQLADEMSELTGTEVTVRRINGFTANSREDYLFPAELTRAFCIATGDCTLLSCLPELSDLLVITEQEAELMELGRQFLAKKAVDERIAILEAKLQRRGL